MATNLGVTILEAVALLRRVEPRAAGELTERKLRYAAAMLGLAPGQSGATVLLDRPSLVAIRLLLRLEASGLSRPLARFAVVCLEPEIRSWLERDREAVILVPLAAGYPKVRRPVILSAAEAKREPRPGVQVPLRELTAGVGVAMRETRREQPQVWQWGPVEPSTATYRLQELRDERAAV